MRHEMRNWYDGTQHNLVRVATSSDGFQVDYDLERGMYRVSIFDELGHFQDEFWFDAYGATEENLSFDLISRRWVINDLDA